MSDAGSKTQMTLRVPDALLARVDVYRRQVMAALPGHEFTRADAIRVLVERGLAASDTETPLVREQASPTKKPKSRRKS